MKEKKLIALNQNFEEIIKEFPNFEEQVNKKIHSTIKKMIDRGERFENINCLINYMIAGGRYVTSYFKSQVREYCSTKYEEHRDYHTILSDYKEDKFFLNYKEYEVENGNMLEYLIFEKQGNEFYELCKSKTPIYLITDDLSFHLYMSVLKVIGLSCKITEAMIKLGYKKDMKIISFDDFQRILRELEVFFRTKL